MTYTMTVCEGENNSRAVRNPLPEAIDQAIDSLIPVIYHFVILEVDPPIEKCAYVQALIEREGRFDGLYLIEARYQFTGFFSHYRKHARGADEVKKIFHAFAKGVAPNTAGWDDITGRVLPNTGRGRNA